MKHLIVIPTYNEADNISLIINKIFELYLESSILVVDDSSPDGTAYIVKDLQKRYKNLYLMSRSSKQGLASAYICGFKWGIEHNFDVFTSIDADFSHNPEYIKTALEYINQGFDFVSGSRYVKNGCMRAENPLKYFLSLSGNFYINFMLGNDVKDWTGGFNTYTKHTLEKINLDSIDVKGYIFQTVMKYKALKTGLKIKEFPITFELRRNGKSKMNFEIIKEAFIHVIKNENIFLMNKKIVIILIISLIFTAYIYYCRNSISIYDIKLSEPDLGDYKEKIYFNSDGSTKFIKKYNYGRTETIIYDKNKTITLNEYPDGKNDGKIEQYISRKKKIIICRDAFDTVQKVTAELTGKNKEHVIIEETKKDGSFSVLEEDVEIISDTLIKVTCTEKNGAFVTELVSKRGNKVFYENTIEFPDGTIKTARKEKIYYKNGLMRTAEIHYDNSIKIKHKPIRSLLIVF